MRKPVSAICEQQRCRSACSLNSAFVVHCLDRIIPKSKISRHQLVSVAEEAGLSPTWSQPLKTGFLVKGLNSACICLAYPQTVKQ